MDCAVGHGTIIIGTSSFPFRKDNEARPRLRQLTPISHKRRCRSEDAEKGVPPVAEPSINFSVPAALKKYPSLNGQWNSNAQYANAYTILDGTLDECIREFMSKPQSQHGLYEIRTAAQPPLVTEILNVEQVVEIARLRDFL